MGSCTSKPISIVPVIRNQGDTLDSDDRTYASSDSVTMKHTLPRYFHIYNMTVCNLGQFTNYSRVTLHLTLESYSSQKNLRKLFWEKVQSLNHTEEPRILVLTRRFSESERLYETYLKHLYNAGRLTVEKSLRQESFIRDILEQTKRER